MHTFQIFHNPFFHEFICIQLDCYIITRIITYSIAYSLSRGYPRIYNIFFLKQICNFYLIYNHATYTDLSIFNTEMNFLVESTKNKWRYISSHGGNILSLKVCKCCLYIPKYLIPKSIWTGKQKLLSQFIINIYFLIIKNIFI